MMATMRSIAQGLRDSLDFDTREQMASAIPSDCDLGDEGCVIKALSAAGWTTHEFYPWLDEITERARAIRNEEPLLAFPLFVLGMIGIAAFFGFVPCDSAQAAILTPEGAEKLTALAPFAVAIGVIVATLIALRWLVRAPIPPLVGDEIYGPRPEPTPEQLYREAQAADAPFGT